MHKVFMAHNPAKKKKADNISGGFAARDDGKSGIGKTACFVICLLNQAGRKYLERIRHAYVAAKAAMSAAVAVDADVNLPGVALCGFHPHAQLAPDTAALYAGSPDGIAVHPALRLSVEFVFHYVTWSITVCSCVHSTCNSLC